MEFRVVDIVNDVIRASLPSWLARESQYVHFGRDMLYIALRQVMLPV